MVEKIEKKLDIIIDLLKKDATPLKKRCEKCEANQRILSDIQSLLEAHIRRQGVSQYEIDAILQYGQNK